MHPDFNDNIIQLSDRVKELSYTTGTNNMVLEGAAPGFSRFQDFYPQSGLVFYAITDGSNYEVGSGHYLATGTTPFYSSEQIRRYPFRSTNSNNKVDWAAGTKEVFVTYPAPFSVFTAFGVDERFKQPERSGIAFWDNDGVASGTNILNYDSSGNWDKDNHFLGLHTHVPGYAIDIAGPAHYAIVKTSGLFLDTSGIIFSGGYDGEGKDSTRQVDPFLKNQVDANTGLNAVIDVSGWVNESLVFKTQAAGQAFLGPVNDCGGGCADGYPAFRVLHHTDIPDLSHLYLTGHEIDPQAMSGIAFFQESGVLTYDQGFVWNNNANKLGINHSNPQVELDLVGDARISQKLTVGGNLEVSGNLDVAGTTTYIDSTNVTIWDKQLELASMSGNATHDQLDSYINDGGIIVRSSGDGASDTGDKKWTWQNSSNTWKAQTSNGNLIGVTASGMIFGNGTAISGAYQGGSGVSIHGFNIDVGNVFSVSGNDDAAYGTSNQQVHQSDNIVVSGVSGVSTWITTSGIFPNSKITLHIDPSALSGVLQGGIDTAGANRWPYASGVGNSGLFTNELFKVSGVGGLIPSHSGFFSEELHEVSGVGGLLDQKVADSGYYISGILQTQISSMGDTGEVNQNAFSIVAISGASPSTWHSTIVSDTKTDTLVIDSGHDNSISIIPDFDNDRFVISGAHQFRLGADNTPSLSSVASGYIGHNDGITISGGYGLTTTNSAGTVTIGWSGGSNLFTLRGDSDAGAGGSTISSDGPSIIDISGGSYITTTRTNDKVVVAFSGLDNVYDWLTDPGSLSAMTSGGADNADEMLIWDDNVGAWKKFTVAEMSSKFSSGSGGSQNLYHTITVDNTDTEYTWDDTSFTPGGTTESLEFVSRNDDLYLAADATTKSVGFGLHNTGSGIAVAISGQLVESGVLQSGILQAQIIDSGQLIINNSGEIVSLATLRASIASPTFTGTPAAPTAALSTDTTQIATTAFVKDVAAASGEDHYENVRASGQILKNLIDTNTTNIALKANIANPTFTGTVAAPTVSPATTDDEKIATTAFVHDVVRASGQLLKVNTGSGIDIYDTSTITANLNPEWYRKEYMNGGTQENFTNIIIGYSAEQKPGSTGSNHGSIAIGNSAGDNEGLNADTQHKNVMIGYRAGYYPGAGKSSFNTFIGNRAGQYEIEVGSDTQEGNTCIGSDAGASRDGVSSNNIFIGRYAGSTNVAHTSQGNNNITIGAFDKDGGEAQTDSVNVNTNHNYKLNIANLIIGDWSVGSTYSKRVKIGDIDTPSDAEPQGTLELKADDTATTTFFIARATSQGQPLMSVESESANYNGSATNTTNQIINKDGFLRIPIFPSRAALNAVSASDNPGMMAIYTKNNGDEMMVFSDGTNWRKTGDVQLTNLPN